MIIYVGEFTENDLKLGFDKKAILLEQEKEVNIKNGIKYIESKYNKKNNTLKIWLTDKF